MVVVWLYFPRGFRIVKPCLSNGFSRCRHARHAFAGGRSWCGQLSVEVVLCQSAGVVVFGVSYPW